MNISKDGISLAFILTFINQYFQGTKGKRMMGKSKNNPQPNQIEGQEEKGKNKTHTNTQKGGRKPGKVKLSYYFPSQEIIAKLI